MSNLSEEIRGLADKARRLSSKLQTEEATKTALLMPFISALGYDVFDPTEVIPEYTADVGIKRGEKVDYAIIKDGKPAILFEAKTAGSDLSRGHASQLLRYFATTEARVGVLTNGVRYMFFMDLEAPNKMDERPFFEFDLSNYSEAHLEQLALLTKDSLNIEALAEAAGDLKYTRALRHYLTEQFQAPSDGWVRFLTQQVYDGRFTQNVREQFRLVVLAAMRRFIADQVNDRLKSALDAGEQEVSEPADLPPGVVALDQKRGTVTTELEMEGYRIVKAIVAKEIPPGRVFMRDTKSYCGVLVDDNNRKPLCRLHFWDDNLVLGLLDENKSETRVSLKSVEDLYMYADQLREAAGRYS